MTNLAALGKHKTQREICVKHDTCLAAPGQQQKPRHMAKLEQTCF